MEWTAFTMPQSSSMRVNLSAVIATFALLVLPAFADVEETGIFIRTAQLIERDSRSIVTAEIEYRFPEVALRALEEGIPLTFSVVLEIDRVGLLNWHERLMQDERTLQLRYQPLAKSYQVSDMASGAVVHHANLSSVIDTLSHLRGWMLPTLPTMTPDEKREASLTFKFDIEALPLPLRLVAYVSPEWKINTPAYRWLLDH
jgi:Domain of unknown function (DUF4390)